MLTAALLGWMALSPAAWAQTAVNTATIATPEGVQDPVPGNNTATDEDPIIAPGLAIAKTHAGDFVVGTDGTYTLTVSNTGTAPTSGSLTVVDTLPAGLGFVSATGTGWSCAFAAPLVTCTSTAVLAPGAAAPAITLVVSVDAAAMPSVVNAARVSGGGDAGCPAAPDAAEARCLVEDPTTVTGTPELALAKTASAAEFIVGEAASYTLSVTNNGEIATTDAARITDTVPAGLTIGTLPAGCAREPAGSQTVACTIPAGLAVGGVASFVIPVVPTGAVAGMTLVNAAQVTGGGDAGCPADGRCNSTVETPVTGSAAIVLTKSATVADTNGNGLTGDPGDTITYAFSVQNTGDVDLAGVTVTDPLLPGLACTLPSLAAGASASCAASGNTYVIQAADVPDGVPNTATVTGTAPGTIPDPSDSDTITTPVVAAAPALALVKTAGTPVDVNGNGITDAGDTIAYSFEVTNTGNVLLQGVAIDDALLSATPITCTPVDLAAGAVATCGPVTYTVTDADVANGSVDNSATATGTPPGGTPVTSTPSTTETPTTAPAPALALVKAAGTPVDVNGNGITDAGDTIAYSFEVTNTGNVPLNGVVINDAMLSATPISCSPADLPVGGVANCGPVTYTVTESDVANGSVNNSATATGTPPGGTPVTSTPSTTETPTTAPAPALALVKTAGTPVDVNGNGITDAGDTIAYSFEVTNTGNVPLAGVVINDVLLSATPISCSPADLPVGGVATCGPVIYTVTDADVAVGSVDNSATATGTPPGGTPVTSTPSTTETPTTAPAPALALVKTAGAPVDVNGNGITDAGDTIAYSFEVTNTGNVPLAGVVINDAMLSATPISCSPTDLAVGGIAICGPVNYTITPVDVENGLVRNSATATGTPPGGTPVTSTPSTTDTPTVAPAAGLSLVKSASAPVDTNGNGLTDAGDTIAYSFTVTNLGNVPLNGVVINDAMLSATPISCSPADLPVGGVATCGPITYTVTDADVAAGSVDNSATATGTPPGGTPVTSTPSTTETPTTTPVPALALVKTAGTPVDVNGNGITDAGDTIAYSFEVTNTGNVLLQGVAIDDALLSATPITCTPVDLAAGAVATCGPVTYTVTDADVANGSVDNSATATGTPPGGTPVTSTPSTTETPTTAPAPALALVKTAGAPVDVNGNGITDAGDTIAYSFEVTNAGNVPLAGVVINDAMLSATPISCSPAYLPVGGVANCGPVTYTVTESDVANGSVDNSATATGTPPGGTPVTSTPSTTETPTTGPTPALALVKTAGTPVDVNGNGITDAGDTIAYSFEVTNTGNVPLNGVVINDAMLSATPISCIPADLPVGGVATCGPANYTITPVDVENGVVRNSATATGTPPGGTPVTSTPSTTETPTTAPAPALALVKTAGTPVDVNGNGITDAGDTIAYSFEVTNTGNVPLNGVVINDAMLSATPISCSPADLPVGGVATCGPVTYTVTTADVTAGSVDNSATATGTPPGGTPVTSTPSTTETPTTAPAPALALVKSAGTPVDVNGNGITDAGDTIAYSFEVTNTGNVPLNGVVINDAMLSATPISCSPADLPVGAVANCGPVTYTVTAADVTAGSVDNSATATGTPPGGTPVTSTPSTTETPTTAPAPALGMVKTAGTPVDVNGNGITDAGDTIAYSFEVTNTGNVPLNGVVINDAMLSATPISCSLTDLPVGGMATCGPITYTVTESDVANGSVDNSATATGTPPGGTPVTSTPSTTETPTTAPAPALGMVKTAGTPVDVNGNGITDAGDTIAYSFEVTNTGNVPLNGVVINDAMLSATPISCSPADLPVGAVANCGPVTYTVTAADVTAGSVDNSATATGTPPGGTPVTSTPSTTETPTTAPAPALALVKAAGTPVDVNGNGITDAGDTIAYSFEVTNTGNVPLNGVVINDAMLSATPISCSPADLPVGAVASCGPVTYTVTAADVANGSVNNSATATGTPPGGTPVTSTPSTTETPTTAPAPALALVKTAGTPVDVNGNGITDAGDTIAYSFEVTNTGNVPLAGVVINDAMLSATPISCSPADLPVGGVTTCGPVTYTVTTADVTAGSVDNSATATGTPPGGTPVTSTPSTTETPTTAPAPALTLVKTAGAPVDVNGNGITDAGDTIAYSFEVTNTGNVPLAGVVINDALLSATPISCSPADLPVGGVATCGPVTYTVTAADVTAGSVDNSATATGTPPGGTPVTSAPSTTTTPVAAAQPSLSSLKRMSSHRDADGDGAVSVGDTLTYAIAVTNTGNVPLQDVAISDPRITPDAVTCGVVVPNATCELVGTYVVTQADADAGRVVNTALVSTQPPGGTVLPPEACPVGSADARCAPTETVTIVQRAAIEVAKTATLTVDGGTTGVGNVGDVIAYEVVATNTGNVTLFDVAVLDAFNGNAPVALDCAPTTLAPGERATCAGYQHTITADEANAGGTLDNLVTASGTAAGGASPVTVTATDEANVRVEPDPTSIRLVKTASPRDVKTGDLVRYTVSIQNTGTSPLVDGSLVDTPPAGFTYVDGSLVVADDDGTGALAGTYPIRVDRIDVAPGARASVTYLLRVGAGVRPGVHTNNAYVADAGATVSNVATADVQMVADPALDESLVLGTVFDDRDGDGWQDSAAMTGVRVQGGFAPGAYVAGSTTLDRGDGPVAEPDASAPLLHGLVLGAIAGRESDADPAQARAIVVSQRLSALDFSDDFVLTTDEGVELRMDAAGNTRLSRGGDAGAAEPVVQRLVSAVEGGYRVDYVIANAGVDERGIPGVRIASVEGLLVETDQFGRYHLVGVDGGDASRGRNFILKVDMATLPPGSVMSTDNPLVRRVTPGLPVRFDFGVTLPKAVVEGGEDEVELELGTFLFEPGSAEVHDAYREVVDSMAAQVRRHGAGEVVIAANGDSQTLAYDRARAVQGALLAVLEPREAEGLQVSLRTEVDDPASTLLSLGESPVLGTVLFETDRADIRPEFLPLLDRIAADIAKLDGGVVGVVGHADRRGGDAYNTALGLRRAKAVFEAIAERLEPGVRSRLRVDISESPTAPVGVRGR